MKEDLRFALRSLGKRPGFALLVVLTLAVAIGANTAIFSVVKGVLLNPLPFEEPDRLVGIWHSAPGLGFSEMGSSPSTHYTYEDEGQSFEAVGLYRPGAATVTGRGDPERVETMSVTGGFLPILRTRPALGRMFGAEDMKPAAARTVLLSDGYWRTKFGGDPRIVGQALVLDGRPHEVIGVLARDFRFLNESPALLTPLQLNRAEVFIGQFSYLGLGRLKPGVTLQQANADAARMLAMMERKFPFPPGMSKAMLDSARLTPTVRPLKFDAVGDAGNVLWILLGTAAVVLLIACANVANLLLVRGEGRQLELGIRAALGADRGKLSRQLLLESLVLSGIGGVLGTALAWAGVRALVLWRPGQIPRLDEISVDGWVLAYGAGISLGAGLLFGMVPVWKFVFGRAPVNLRDGGRTSSQGKERHRARNVLVVAQMAMAAALLVSSGLMLRTFQSLKQVDPGFRNPEQVLTMRISIPESQVAAPMDVVRMQERMLRALEAVPGVRSVAYASSAPMDGNQSSDPVFVEEFPEPGGKMAPVRRFRTVSPGYFSTIGNRLLAGRDSDWTDVMEQRNVLVVSESFARIYWKSPREAVGKRVRESPRSPWREIIGVAGDELDDGAHRPAPVIVYWPAAVRDFWEPGTQVQRSATFLVRSERTGSASFLKDVQAAVWSVNPGVPTANVRSLAKVQDLSMMRTSFTLMMLGLAGAVALVLGVVGIYAVIAYAVTHRTREVGIRMALGAQRGDVSGLFVRQGLLLTSAGIAAGLAGASFGTRLMASLLFGVKPVDPLTYAAVAAVLAAAALLACYLPARRAAAMDPVKALHSD